MSNVSKTPLPEFRPRCLGGLNDLLGRSDATVEWIEVAVRHLKQVNDNEGTSKSCELASWHGIKVNLIDFNDLPVQWASLQVLSVYQKLEWFLLEFRDEHPRKVRSRNNGEDLLAYTLDAFNVSKHNVGILEYDILDYYRLVRNHLMHKPIEKQAKKHINQCESINERTANSVYAKLDAPCKLTTLGFDDFILFSRALKNFARSLCAATCPTAQELAALLEVDVPLRKALRRVNQNPERVQKKLASHLRRYYGFPSCADDLSSAILKECPLAQR